MRPRPTPSEEVTVSDLAYPKIPHCRRGKWHHHGGDVCGLVVLGVDGTFRTIPTVRILRANPYIVVVKQLLTVLIVISM